MLIDTHCHLKLTADKLGITIEELIEETISNNVGKMVNINISEEDFELLEKFDWPDSVCHAAGLHPTDINNYKLPIADLLEKIRDYAQNGKIIAIGECGLDYHWYPETKEKQLDVCRKQLEIAKEFDLPVILHLRDSGENPDMKVFPDVFPVLSEFSEIDYVWHSFTGSLEEANLFLDLNPNNRLGINGILTLPKSEILRSTVKQIPKERVILETDSPFLSPLPHRGKPCKPSYIKNTYLCLNGLIDVSEEDLVYNSNVLFTNGKT